MVANFWPKADIVIVNHDIVNQNLQFVSCPLVPTALGTFQPV